MDKSTTSIDHNSWRPSHNPWIICVAVMLATIMEVLDSTITNVSLPHIAGNLAVSTHEATWVATSYLVSNAIILPATAWFSSFFGRKRFLVGCIVLFTLASLLCGFATSLGFLLFARILQGLGGGALMPISQAVLFESFPKEKHGVAMAVFAIGVVVAPIVGPVIGGWLTDNYSWRWVFFINLPIGAISILMANRFIEDPPYIRKESNMIDYIGFLLMAIGIGTLQIILDKGQEVDWFQAPWLRNASVIMAISLVAFVWWELRTKHPVVDLRILKDRNFFAGLIAALLIGACLYGCLTILPLFYQTLLGYSAYLGGLATAPQGIGALIGAVLVGRLTDRFDGRIFFVLGLSILIWACINMGCINLQIGMQSKTVGIIAFGIGATMSFVPLSTLSMGRLNKKDMGNGSGLFNLMRNIGGSVGIAVMTTILARKSQVHQALMTSHITPYDYAYQQTANAMPKGLANGLIYQNLLRQSALLAYIDSFYFFAILAMICILTVFFYKKIDAKNGAMAGIH